MMLSGGETARTVPFRVALASIALIVALITSAVGSIASCAPSPQEFDFNEIISRLDYGSIVRHVQALSSYGSRVTGYDGYYKALNYITNYFVHILGKENVILQNYTVVAPKDLGTKITVIKNGKVLKTLDAYCVWPNYIQTWKVSGLRGRLIYAKSGDLRDFNGLQVNGSIVLMDFNSGDNWVNAARLGAKAVIFTEPSGTTRWEAMAKFLNVPLYFPRFYVRKEDSDFLLNVSKEEGVEVVIDSEFKWEKVTAANVIGIINGTRYPDEIIVVAAHFDAWSVVPKLAPGADEAVSVASLLELARYFSENRPLRTVYFVALSGHWQALAGAREFVEKFFFSPDVVAGRKRIYVFVALDFSTDGSDVALLYRGHMYDFGASGPMLRWLRWLQPRIFNYYIPLLEKQTGKRYSVRDGFHPSGSYGWWASIPEPYMLDSEPFAVAHGLSFTVRTDNVLRLQQGHPFDTWESVNFNNLKPQLEVAAAIVYGLANEPSIGITYSEVAPSRYLFTAAGGDLAGFMTVKGKVWTFNVSRGWYTEVPNAVVVACRVDVSYSSYPFSRIITMSDEKGSFEIHGVSGYGYGHGYGRVDVWHFEAYKLSEETGVIEYAPDQGQYGRMRIRFDYEVNAHPYNVTTVVFRAVPIEIFDLVDPTTYRPLMYMNPVFRNTLRALSSRPWTLTLYDAQQVSQFVAWGLSAVGYEKVAVLFVPPRAKGLLIFRAGPNLNILGILTNSSPEYPEGRGFGGLEEGRLSIPFTALAFAKDTLTLAEGRYNELKRFMVINPVVEYYLDNARRHLKEAEEYLGQKVYDKAYSKAYAAWSYSVAAYASVMGTIYDTVNTSLLVFALLLFFSLFFERLTLSATGVKALLSVPVIFLAAFAVYLNVHPAPKIASNVLLGPLSLTSLILFIVMLAVFTDKLRFYSREFREKVMGAHIIEKMPYSSLTGMAMSQAPRNIRARALRSALIFVTVAATAFSLTALTSVSPLVEAKVVNVEGVPLYQGLLVKRDLQYAPDLALEPEVTMLMEALSDWKVTIIPRAWYYPPSVGGEGVLLELKSSTSSYRVKALMGVAPNEMELLKSALVEGDWFGKWDVYSCILPRNVAEALNVSVGDKIRIFSQEFTVKGVIEPSVLNRVLDLDNYAMTPANPDNIPQLTIRPITTEIQQKVPLSWEQVVLVPYRVALEMGGFLASVTVVGDQATVERVAKDAALILGESKLLFTQDKRVCMPSPVGWYSVAGLEYVVIPIAIASLNVASLLFATVREREREIKVYSAVGLAPSGIILIFVTEALIYAIIGCVIGYFVGIAANIAMVKLGFLPKGFIVNFSSIASLLGIIIPLLAAVVASLWPAYAASKLITPSLERRWRPPTRPKGDVWEVPLPFSVESDAEALGVLAFVAEYLESRTVESEDPFIVHSVNLLPSEMAVTALMQLIPLDAGVWQELKLAFAKSGDRLNAYLTITRKSGVREIWASRNYIVIDCVRKQMLLWRSLSPDIRRKYMGKRTEGV
jgi:hypothetical protein